MNLEIFMGLIGVPGGIILTAVICYAIQTKRDQAGEKIEVKQEKGVSQ